MSKRMVSGRFRAQGLRRAEVAMTTHPPSNQAMERNNELRVACTLRTAPAPALVEPHVSSPETLHSSAVKPKRVHAPRGGRGSRSAAAEQASRAARAARPAFRGAPRDLCTRTCARARVHVQAVFFAHTFSPSAASILSHEHRAVVIHVDLAPTATEQADTREPTAH